MDWFLPLVEPKYTARSRVSSKQFSVAKPISSASDSASAKRRFEIIRFRARNLVPFECFCWQLAGICIELHVRVFSAPPASGERRGNSSVVNERIWLHRSAFRGPLRRKDTVHQVSLSTLVHVLRWDGSRAWNVLAWSPSIRQYHIGGSNAPSNTHFSNCLYTVLFTVLFAVAFTVLLADIFTNICRIRLVCCISFVGDR